MRFGLSSHFIHLTQVEASKKNDPEVQAKFIEIQTAYETLNGLYKRRAEATERRNAKAAESARGRTSEADSRGGRRTRREGEGEEEEL